MPRASETQKAERLNRARDLLLHFDQLSVAVERLARDCSISSRQAFAIRRANGTPPFAERPTAPGGVVAQNRRV